jgi:hypothetical protein
VKRSSFARRSSRKLGIALFVFGLIGIPLAGCQQLGLASDEPGRLLEEARANLEQKDLEAAYPHLRRIRTEYPESPECDAAFPLAAGIWKELWYRDRYARPDSAWRTSEAEFMLQWLASYFEGAEEFPRKQVNDLLRSMPYSFYQEFAAYAAAHPQMSSWVLQAEDDDGRIRSVSGKRAQTPPL